MTSSNTSYGRYLTEYVRAEVEAHVRGELQTETERKVRLALVQQMRPQVRAELENALRLEIRTAYSQEIRKEVEAALTPELEKRIASDYKAKHQRTQSAQKEQAEAALQAQLAEAKKEMEDRMRRDAETKVARKMAKQTESEVKARVEKMRQEVKAECEAEARKHVEASLAQIKQERAEIARLRAVENVRRTREDAAHKDAEAEFHKKVAEFRRHVQEEEARIARMKAVVQWRDEHLRRPQSSLSTVTPTPNAALAPAPTHIPTSATQNSPSPPSSPTPPPSFYNASPNHARNPSPKRTTPAPPVSSAPARNSSPMVSIAMPEISTTSPPQLRTPSPTVKSTHASHVLTTAPPVPSHTNSNTNHELHVQPSKSHNAKPPAGVAFDFTFDVKLIAAKLISDARDIVQPHDNKITSEVLGNQHGQSSSLTTPSIAPFQHSTPTRPNNRMPSPSRGSGAPVAPTTPAASLGHIATEQRAQREFESQPFIPPQGSVGARLRVLLPRLYQLWDESEISHVFRLDFCSALHSLDVSSAERRVAMEISRLRKTFPSIQKEMALVARRESIKAQLARDDSILGGEAAKKERLGAERGQLQAELRRITTATHAAIVAWESVHNTPFMYRGFPYRSLLSSQ